MPAIREYTNTIDQIRPNNAGAGALADLAGAQGRAGYYNAQQIKERGQDLSAAITDVGRAAGTWYEQNHTKMEISQGGTLFTQKEMDYTKEWKDITSKTDPNDASIGPKFLEKVFEDLDKSVDGATSYGGKEWMRKQADSMKLGWFKQINADVATRAGQAIKDNIVKSTNTAGSIVSMNPTALDRQLELQTDMINGILKNSPNLNEATRAQLSDGAFLRGQRGEIIQRGMQAMMDANPQAGLAVLQSGKYAADLTPDAYKALENYAGSVEKRKETEGKAREVAAKAQRSDAFYTAAQKIDEAGIIRQPDGSVVVKPDYFKNTQDLLKIDPSKLSEVRAMTSYGDRLVQDAAKGVRSTDHADTYESFSNRIFLGTEDPNNLKMEEVYRARSQGLLSDKSFAFFKDAVTKDYKDPAKSADYREFNKTMDYMKPSFVKGSLFGADDGGVGMRNFMRFRQEKFVEYQAGRKAGISPADLLSEKSAKSIVSDWSRYRLSAEDQLKMQQERMRGGAMRLPEPTASAGPLPPGQTRVYNELELSPLDGAPAGALRYKPGESMDELFKRRSAK